MVLRAQVVRRSVGLVPLGLVAASRAGACVYGRRRARVAQTTECSAVNQRGWSELCAWSLGGVASRAMSNGPIEFASDGPRDEKGPTEYGGRAGLIQGGAAPGEVHELTGPEKRGIIVRADPATKVDPLTGFVVADEAGVAVDPVTGLPVDPVWNEDGATGKPVDAPPRTGEPTAGEL